jgi:hypothetical protein
MSGNREVRMAREPLSWRKVTIEAGAIVASILLAFGIDAGWDARQERDTERAAIEVLRLEVRANRQILAETIRYNDEARASVVAYLRLSPQQITSMPRDSFPSSAMHVQLWAPFTFDPELGGTTAFINRGESASEAVRALGRAVVNWDRTFVDAGEESVVLWGASRAVLELLTPYIVDLVPQDELGPVLNVILQDYLPRMARIRADPRVIAAALAKLNLQGIYTNELRDLLDATDNILGLLDAMPNAAG